MTKEEAKRRMEICRDFLANNYSDMGEPNFMAFNMAIQALQEEPQRAKGHLVSNQQDGEVKAFWERYRCSVCGEYAQDNFNYCSRCGAELEGEEE